jgi:hypothetical protein
LAQVHAAVVRLHGGTVHFDSREHEGTCFVVALARGHGAKVTDGVFSDICVMTGRSENGACTSYRP